MKVLKIVLIVFFGLSHTFSQSPFDEEKEVKDESNVVKESSPLTEEIDAVSYTHLTLPTRLPV